MACLTVSKLDESYYFLNNFVQRADLMWQFDVD